MDRFPDDECDMQPASLGEYTNLQNSRCLQRSAIESEKCIDKNNNNDNKPFSI